MMRRTISVSRIFFGATTTTTKTNVRFERLLQCFPSKTVAPRQASILSQDRPLKIQRQRTYSNRSVTKPLNQNNLSPNDKDPETMVRDWSLEWKHHNRGEDPGMVFQWLIRQDGNRLTISTFESFFEGVVWCHKQDSQRSDLGHLAVQALERMVDWQNQQQQQYLRSPVESTNKYTYCFHKAMTLCCKLGDVGRAEGLLRELSVLHQQNPQMFPVFRETYSIVISGYSNQQSPGQAEAVLRTLLSQGMLSPHKDDFESCLTAWKNASRDVSAGQRAELLLLQMQELALSKGLDTLPDAVSFLKVIQAWANSRRPNAPERTLEVLQLMEKMDLAKYDPSSKNCITKAHEESIKLWSRRPDGAPVCEDLYSKLVAAIGPLENQASTTHRIYAGILEAWAKSDRPDKMERGQEFFDSIEEHRQHEKDKIYWSVPVYRGLLSLYSQQGKAPEAEAVLRKMESEYSALSSDQQTCPRNSPFGSLPPQPDTKCYNLVLLSWSKSRKSEAAIQAAKLFQDMPVPKDVVTYNALFAALAFHPDYTNYGMEVFDSMRQDGRVRPTTVTYNQVLRLWTNQQSSIAVDAAQTLIREMDLGPKGSRPNQTTYNIYETIVRENEKGSGKSP